MHCIRKKKLKAKLTRRVITNGHQASITFILIDQIRTQERTELMKIGLNKLSSKRSLLIYFLMTRIMSIKYGAIMLKLKFLKNLFQKLRKCINNLREIVSLLTIN